MQFIQLHFPPIDCKDEVWCQLKRLLFVVWWLVLSPGVPFVVDWVLNTSNRPIYIQLMVTLDHTSCLYFHPCDVAQVLTTSNQPIYIQLMVTLDHTSCLYFYLCDVALFTCQYAFHLFFSSDGTSWLFDFIVSLT